MSYMKVDEWVLLKYVMELHIEKLLRLEAQSKMSRIEVSVRFLCVGQEGLRGGHYGVCGM